MSKTAATYWACTQIPSQLRENSLRLGLIEQQHNERMEKLVRCSELYVALTAQHPAAAKQAHAEKLSELDETIANIEVELHLLACERLRLANECKDLVQEAVSAVDALE